MFDDLLKNIEQEKKILTDLKSLHAGINIDPEKKQFYMKSAQALLHQLRILNNSVPQLLKAWSPLNTEQKKTTKASTITRNPKTAKSEKKLVVSPTPQNTVRMAYTSPVTKEKQYVTINKDDKRLYLEKLKLSEEHLKGLKKKTKDKKETESKKPSGYARISNKYFRGLAETLAPNFTSLETDIKKANLRFLLTTYLAMAIFSVFLTLMITVILILPLIFLGLISWTFLWAVILLPTVVATSFYLYPSSEAGNAQKKVNRELPFATIHMAAIAGSDITPTKIFQIISTSSDYPAIGAEIKKILIQIQVYGYDVVTSLKNVATRTSNKRFSELLSGIATNISSGGSLKDYLQKKAENFLLDYKLERQKYANLAGTFMDVYISILIAAPLVLMMMFIVMNVAGLGLEGIGITTLLFLSVLGITIINIIFLVILNIKQPKV